MSKVLQNKKQLLVFLFAMLLNALGMRANPVDMNAAREVAVKFVNANTKVPLRGTDELQLVTTYRTESDDAAFHIFNTPNGFVIVAADDCVTPILGYSDEGRSFNPDNIAIQLQDILQGFVEQIQYGIENNLESDEQTARKWEQVRTTGRLNNNRSNRTVEPLLTTKWNQDYPYDMYVPNGCPTGCGATAMAQIMKYWEWPVQGIGEHSYQWNGQTLSANFGETIYDWDNMLNDYNYYNNNQPTQEQEEAVATLMWHCGVSVNMDYSPGGSTPSLSEPSSLINYFSYSDEMSEESRYFFSDALWKAKLKDCLGLGRPLIYGGAPDDGVGHAFVCDGYDTNELFHFNFGWGGTSDGYYTIDGLDGGYSDNSGAIFNIHPQGETTTYVINVSVNSVEGGSVTGGGTFVHGENVTLSATANDGYGFCYWEENGGIASTNPNYLFTANYNRDLVAVFAEPFTVTVSASEGGTAVGGGSYFYGESCAVTATPNEGYDFANWTANDFVVSVDANYTYNVTGNTLLTAHFVPEGNIEFADTNVKAICVANWDTNGDGELSYAEAAAVMSLGEVFRGNTEITSFEELQYFISLTSISKYAFDGCSGLTGSLIIPEFVASIGRYAFRDCSGLGSLIIPNTVTSIGRYAFYHCGGLHAVYYAGDIHQWCNIQFNNSLSNPLAYAHNIFIDNELVTELVIPETVTKVMPYAFVGATCLSSLTISNSVISIGSSAFDGCSGLTGSLIIPNTVTSIGGSAFYNCSGLTGDLTIPNTVTSISSGTFNNCSGFTGELVIPNSVTSIGATAFGNCSGLTSLDLGNSVTTIDIYSFNGCSGLTGSLIIPNSVTSIGAYAFYDCDGLTSLALGNSVTSIGEGAFYYCRGLTSMAAFAETPPTLESSVFYQISNNIPIYVPCESVEAYQSAEGWNAFPNIMCISSGTISVVADPLEGGEVSGAGTYEGGAFCTVTATPNEGYCFANWTENGHIVSSNSNYSFVVTGESVLTAHFVLDGNIVFADANVKAICVVNWDANGDGELSYAEAAVVTSLGEAFSENTEITSFEELQYFIKLSTIDNWAFYGCSSLTGSLIIPNSVSSIGYYAFYNCSGFTSLTIGNSVISIGTNAFQNCNGLTSIVVLAETPPTVGSNAFYNVPTNIPVYVPCEFLETYQTAEGWNAFSNIICICSSGTISVAADPMEGGDVSGAGTYEGGTICTVVAIPNEGYHFANWTKNGIVVSFDANYSFVVASDNLLTAHFMTEGNIVFADSNVKAICVANWDTNGDGELSYIEAASVASFGEVFKGNTEINSFEELQYFIGLTTIGNEAFYNCTGLTGSLTIPNSVTSIGNYAFYHCSGLTGELSIPNSVTSIGEWAFCGCSGFTGDLTIPNSVTSIGGWTFYNCSGFTGSLIISNSVTLIDKCTFYGCSGFTDSLIIPNSVTTIEWNAFCNCSGFTGSLTIPNSVISIGDDAFKYCSGFTGSLIIPNSVTFIGNNAFYNCSGFTGSLSIPNSVTSVGGSAFSGCSGFTGNLIIPNSLTTISQRAFSGCSGLTGDLIIPNSVISIVFGAFEGCSGLTSLTLPNALTSIGNLAFSGCSGLTSLIILADNPLTVNSNVFNNVNKSIPVYVPCGSLEAYQNANGWNQFTNIQEVCTQPQTILLSEGWNWFSTNVDITLDDLKDALIEALPNATSITIKGKNAATTYNGITWRGQLNTLDVTQMYKIEIPSDCEITLEGLPINPAEHPVTITANAANWIAFPLSESMSLGNAFAGFAVSGDQVKGKSASATYNGTQWRGTLNTLVPGQGYRYISNTQGNRTLIFPASAK